jgi:hypothetical protein
MGGVHGVTEPGRARRYVSAWASENIAAGYADAAGTVRQWVDSAPHRANVLSRDMRATGIARHQGGVRGWYWTADFGNLTNAIAGAAGRDWRPGSKPRGHRRGP